MWIRIGPAFLNLLSGCSSIGWLAAAGIFVLAAGLWVFIIVYVLLPAALIWLACVGWKRWRARQLALYGRHRYIQLK